MIKIEVLRSPWSLYDDDQEDVIEKMREWCRNSFGKNTRGQRSVWRTGSNWVQITDPNHPNYDDDWGEGYETIYYFYFTTEQQASWFRLTWGMKIQ